MTPTSASAAPPPPRSLAPRRGLVLRGLAAAVLAALSAAPARGEEAPRWKLKPGDVLRFVMTQDTTNTFKRGPGFESTVTMSQTVDLHWEVKGLASDGEADVVQAVDRIRCRIDGAGEASALAFDSDAKPAPPPDGPIASRLVPLLRALVHAEFTFKATPRGEIRDVKIPEKLMALVRQANPAGGNTVFSDEGIKNLVAQVGLVLPESPPRRGESWTRRSTSTIPMPPLGAMTIDRTFTFEREEGGSGRVKAAMASTMAIQPNPDFRVKATIDRQRGEGAYVFDADLGRLVSSHVEEELVMTLSDASQSAEQTTKTVTNVTLAGDPAPK